MRDPIHNIKRRYAYYKVGDTDYEIPIGAPSDAYFKIFGWLGSGVKDINGREIFEGDILADGDCELFEVKFANGQFRLYPYVSHHSWIPLADLADSMEVIRHVAEEEPT